MTLLIDGPAGELEASYHNPAQAQNAALLCHPHPSYGGSMHDGVLALTTAALDSINSDKAGQASPWAHLRFNFRGVGASSGTYDNGLGEQEDLLAAWNWLRAQKHWSTLALVGYSFGSAMAWAAHQRCAGLDQLLLIAPPSAGMAFSVDGASDPVATHIIVGERDDYCDRASLPPHESLQVLPDADHFFSASSDLLSKAIGKVF